MNSKGNLALNTARREIYIKQLDYELEISIPW